MSARRRSSSTTAIDNKQTNISAAQISLDMHRDELRGEYNQFIAAMTAEKTAMVQENDCFMRDLAIKRREMNDLHVKMQKLLSPHSATTTPSVPPSNLHSSEPLVESLHPFFFWISYIGFMIEMAVIVRWQIFSADEGDYEFWREIFFAYHFIGFGCFFISRRTRPLDGSWLVQGTFTLQYIFLVVGLSIVSFPTGTYGRAEVQVKFIYPIVILLLFVDEFLRRKLKNLSRQRLHKFLTETVLGSFSSLIPLIYINLEVYKCIAEDRAEYLRGEEEVDCRGPRAAANFLNLFLFSFMWMKLALVPLVSDDRSKMEQFTAANIAQLNISTSFKINTLMFIIVGVQGLYYFTLLSSRTKPTEFDYYLGSSGVFCLIIVFAVETASVRRQFKDDRRKRADTLQSPPNPLQRQATAPSILKSSSLPTPVDTFKTSIGSIDDAL